LNQQRIVALETRVQELIVEKGDAVVENTNLRKALQKLLDLDAQRPVDPTWWRKWWDEARAEAEALLLGASTKEKASAP
jgi:hypothetical protein